MKYTTEQYAASARKYGITQGPWRKTKNSRGAGFVIDATSRRVASIHVGETASMERIHADAQQVESVPELLIERDALKEALTEAVALIRLYHGPAGWVEYQQSPEMKRIRAALKGGGS